MTVFSLHHITILLSIGLLISAMSCSDQSEQVSSALAAADSLMLTQPQVALDTLSGIDSTEVRKMSRRDRAFYTLLTTEAHYKCYLPVVEDTAIFEVAAYYQKHGPDIKFARASMMCGAVAHENGNPVQALLSYKNAEPVLAQSGDIEQLGLLHTRIGELYTLSFVNNKDAADRYRKALACFQLCGREDREIPTHLSLARVMLGESADTSYSHTLHAIALARKLKDTIALVSGYELMTHICGLKEDYPNVILFSNAALSEVPGNGSGHLIQPILNNIHLEQAIAYASLGMPDSAEATASRIKWQNNAPDSMARHWVASAIAESRGEWRQAFLHSQRYHAMTDSIENASRHTQLRNMELLYDRQTLEARNREMFRERHLILTILAVILLAVIGITAALYQKYKKLRGHYENLLASINICSEKEIQDIGSSLMSSINDSRYGNELKNDVRSLIMDMTNMISEMNGTYFKYKDNIKSLKFVSGFDNILKKYFPEKHTYEKIRRLCGALYPGVLEQIERDHPALSRNDLLLIALMGCGFPTGAICAVKGMTVGSLNSQKTRTAKKIGPEVRLSEYVALRFSKNMSAAASQTRSCHDGNTLQPDFCNADIE